MWNGENKALHLKRIVYCSAHRDIDSNADRYLKLRNDLRNV